MSQFQSSFMADAEKFCMLQAHGRRTGAGGMAQRNGIAKSGIWRLVWLTNFSIGLFAIAAREIGFWRGDMIERPSPRTASYVESRSMVRAGWDAEIPGSLIWRTPADAMLFFVFLMVISGG